MIAEHDVGHGDRLRGGAPGIDAYLSGTLLYGDDFTGSKLEGWYARESEAYASLATDHVTYQYPYHALNRYHLFRHLPPMDFAHALLFGGAFGDELLPVATRVAMVTILDSSASFERSSLPAQTARVAANSTGDISLDDGTVDLVMSLGALHHIANVSYVFGELVRVLRPGGFFLLREPTVSMGDWRRPRRGLTPCERGIPLNHLDHLVSNHHLQTIARRRCMMAGFAQVATRVGTTLPYSRMGWVSLDALTCRCLSWNTVYHATRTWERLRPLSLALVLRKPSSPHVSRAPRLQ